MDRTCTCASCESLDLTLLIIDFAMLTTYDSVLLDEQSFFYSCVGTAHEHFEIVWSWNMLVCGYFGNRSDFDVFCDACLPHVAFVDSAHV